MDEKICIDSDILIGVLRKDLKAKSFIGSINGELCTTSINSFEIWLGRKDLQQTDELLSSCTVFYLDEKSARRAADIQRELQKTGNTIEFRDLFIAAIAIENGLALATFNKKHFERLSGFGLKMVET